MGISGSPVGAVTLLPRSFYERDVLTCARELIGCVLHWNGCSGVVVETEAYSAVGDEASHAFTRPSTRAYMASHLPGSAYVYFNYGVHWMLNVLVKGNLQCEAVPENGIILIRAVEPLEGVEILQERRGKRHLHELCSGPGKLAQAFGITGADHGRDLTVGPCGFGPRVREAEVECDVRIGISRSKELPWRFLMKDSPFVSKRKTRRPTFGAPGLQGTFT